MKILMAGETNFGSNPTIGGGRFWIARKKGARRCVRRPATLVVCLYLAKSGDREYG